jgi:mannose/fructose/N-acetylgalactosamine-specific phosphotransferase system component IIC
VVLVDPLVLGVSVVCGDVSEGLVLGDSLVLGAVEDPVDGAELEDPDGVVDGEALGLVLGVSEVGGTDVDGTDVDGVSVV